MGSGSRVHPTAAAGFWGKGFIMEAFLRILGLVLDVLPSIVKFVHDIVSGKEPTTKLALPAPEPRKDG
jgi:hypothetical protein